MKCPLIIFAVRSLQSIEWTCDSSFENETILYKLLIILSVKHMIALQLCLCPCAAIQARVCSTAESALYSFLFGTARDERDLFP